MGCSKPLWEPCPLQNSTAPQTGCFGCQYHTQDMGAYLPQMAKFISQFTNEELLAEIRRRMGT